MGKNSDPRPQDDSSYPQFERGPWRHTPETDHPNPEHAESLSEEQKPRKFSLDDAETFIRPGFTGYKQVSLEQGVGFSALTIFVHGKHPHKRMIEGTRTYYVTEGQGSFTLDEEVHQVEEGNLFVIPPDGIYSYQGSMTLFEMNIPSAEGRVVDEKLDQ